MEENNFESKIQERLNRLKLNPSEEVWLQVEQRVAKRKKRRIFLFVFSVLGILLASGIYWYEISGTGPEVAGKAAENLVETKGAETRDHTIMDLNQQPTPQFKADSIPEKEEQTITAIRSLKQDTIEKKWTERFAITESPKRALLPDNNTGTNSNNFQPASGMPVHINLATTSGRQKDMERDILEKQGIPLKHENPFVQRTKEAEKKNSWSWGVDFSGGVSSFIKSTASTELNFQSAPAPGGNLNQNSGNNNAYPPSDFKPSIGFSAGFFIEKQWLDRLKVSTGLRYSLASVTNRTGQKVVSGNVLNYSGGGAVYYNDRVSSSQRFQNRFHFVELPVSLSLQLNRNARLPVDLKLGLHMSYLWAANALQYDDSLSLYFKDHSLYPATYLGFHAGLVFTLHHQKKVPLRLAPSLRYEFQPFNGKGWYRQEHLSFIGVEIGIPLKK